MARASKKGLIMKTAKQLFAEKGYDATGMEEIASNAGVPKSLIYYHFKSKEDLLNAVITEFVDEYKEILHDSRAEGIEKISVYMEFLKQNRDCARILMSEQPDDAVSGAGSVDGDRRGTIIRQSENGPCPLAD